MSMPDGWRWTIWREGESEEITWGRLPGQLLVALNELMKSEPEGAFVIRCEIR